MYILVVTGKAASVGKISEAREWAVRYTKLMNETFDEFSENPVIMTTNFGGDRLEVHLFHRYDSVEQAEDLFERQDKVEAFQQLLNEVDDAGLFVEVTDQWHRIRA